MKIIDMDSWPRRQQFELYRDLDMPYVGICADVEITALLAYCQQHQLSSYRAIIYAVLLLSDELPWLRQRIRGEQVIEHEQLVIGATALSDDQQLRFSRIPHQSNWPEFNAEAKRIGAMLAHSRQLFNDDTGSDSDGAIFVSCLPWLRFTQFTHPVPVQPSCSIPRLGWGKYDKQAERTVMPLSLQVHHGLADGIHIAQFYQKLEQRFATPEQWLTPVR
ncbi:CatA-like O-acetyltransferase [uncultured Ferrimonas sp.]|uniref:CatA-like O-acetyltransferase n=1 Tax=uncultured Ferrimonas sp. TaxID=432640 RepID=UPI002637D3E9|nr:CatA-like O-acetyltransferase [uncultured Ferrimonas sp.]